MFEVLLFAAAVASPASDGPRFIGTRLRDDGVTLYCVEHAKRPSLLTPKVECNTRERWARVVSVRGRTSVDDPSFAYQSIADRQANVAPGPFAGAVPVR